MAIADPEIIKNIVRRNFDKSAELYDQFEAEYKLFENLTLKLAENCNLKSGMAVCDIGCGTGSSSYSIRQLVGSKGKVIGVDFSLKMLRAAEKKMKKNEKPTIDFVLCDAAQLDENISSKLDCVMYNASIFLIPDPYKALRSAYSVLKSSGVVAMNYLIGIYDNKIDDNNSNYEIPPINLFQRAKLEKKSFAPYGRSIFNTDELPIILGSLDFRNIRTGVAAIELPLEAAMAFYSIPAQSAALWPKLSYQKRLPMLESLFNYYRQAGVEKYYQYWAWCAGEK